MKIEEVYDFYSINVKIVESNSIIERNIEKINEFNRGFLSQNVLAHLRTFVELISFKIYLDYMGSTENINYNNNTVRKALDYIKSRGNIKFIERFHYYLQISTSHYVSDDDSAERLMLKYYNYLILLKDYFYREYNIKLLNNIDKFPVNLDNSFFKYYQDIALKLDNYKLDRKLRLENEKYYVQKVKNFFINGHIYYEITLSSASDNLNKYDRIIVFSSFPILSNYAIRLNLRTVKVNILGRLMDMKVVCNWQVAIRACEVKNFYKIMGVSNYGYQANGAEYRLVMNLLTNENYNFLEIVMLADEYYEKIRNYINSSANSTPIFDLLDKCRYFIKNNLRGSNVLKYLLYSFNNKLIKDQYCFTKCSVLSDLNLSYSCIPFDDMPYASSLKKHNVKFSDLLEIISPIGREHELLANCIKSNTEINNKLYTSVDELSNFENISELVEKYNDNLYYLHKPYRCLEINDKYVYFSGCETDTIYIINKINELSSFGIENYNYSFKRFLKESNYVIDCSEKKNILLNLFSDSKVALIYGAAGTGKSTLIKHLSTFFKDSSKIFLANTNAAVENLRRNVEFNNQYCSTIYSFLSKQNYIDSCDLLVIDECSTVSNSDMREILEKTSFKMLLLVGDVYQIESISFGNWFYIAKNLTKPIYELSNTWRSSDQDLLTLWNLVRTSDDRIDEMLTKKRYSFPLEGSDSDVSILEKRENDEIVLCLNYDGLYGINNINKYLQNQNSNAPFIFKLNTYKIGDPVIFNDSRRFFPVIYNNLKGIICNIEEDESRVWFTIELYKSITQDEISHLDLEILDNLSNGNTIIKFFVDKYRDSDEDEDIVSYSEVPFSVSYAVSIHKSQGLEYESVKIIITNEIDDLITHNIFYTAITRAKKKLKIFWTPECQNKVISTIKHVENKKDSIIIQKKIKNIK